MLKYFNTLFRKSFVLKQPVHPICFHDLTEGLGLACSSNPANHDAGVCINEWLALVKISATSLHPTCNTFLSILEPFIIARKPNLSVLIPLKDYINMWISWHFTYAPNPTAHLPSYYLWISWILLQFCSIMWRPAIGTFPMQATFVAGGPGLNV